MVADGCVCSAVPCRVDYEVTSQCIFGWKALASLSSAYTKDAEFLGAFDAPKHFNESASVLIVVEVKTNALLL